MNKSKAIAGLGWYEKEQWPEYLRMMEDEVDKMHKNWLRNALRLEAAMKKQGMQIVRVPVDLADFDFWCTVHKKKRDGASRSEYVAEKFNREYGSYSDGLSNQ